MSLNKRFISFEGIDFSGKSTQINNLKNKLVAKNQEVIILREPGGTQISELIRKILLDKKNLLMTSETEMLLYSAARNQLLNEKIIPALEKGSFVIADRYVDSTTAYQGYGRQISFDLIRQVNHVATNGFLPSLTIFLDLPLETMNKRQENTMNEIDRLESAGSDFFKRVREGYLKIADTDNNRVKVLNADQNISKLSNQIWELVCSKLDFKQ
ncbi:MAG: dTMP kinase [Calditrichia bacterium]|nr:dTMP kinase [Calditrichia bacterium]